MYLPQFNIYGSLYPAFLSETASLVMYHRYIETHIGHKNYEYTKLRNSAGKSKMKDFNSPRDDPLIFIDCLSNNIKEYFHLCKPDNINLSEKSKINYVKDIINTVVKHFNSM